MGRILPLMDRISGRSIFVAASVVAVPFAYLAGDYNGEKRCQSMTIGDFDRRSKVFREKLPAGDDFDILAAMEQLSAKRKDLHRRLLNHHTDITNMGTKKDEAVLTDQEKTDLGKNTAMRLLMQCLLKRLEGVTLMTVAELMVLEAGLEAGMGQQLSDEKKAEAAVLLQSGLGLAFLADYTQATIMTAQKDGAPPPNFEVAAQLLPKVDQVRFRWSFGCNELPNGFGTDAKHGLRDHGATFVGSLERGGHMKHKDLKWVSFYEQVWPADFKEARIEPRQQI